MLFTQVSFERLGVDISLLRVLCPHEIKLGQSDF